ncbi:MAG TPA: AAA family ATPase [Gaiellaceae bacterium]
MDIAVDGLVGREAELALVGRALDSVRAGPAAFVIQGEPGIGKTILWEAALADASARGHTVLRASGAQAEVQLLLGALGDLFDGVHETVLPLLPAPQRQALAVALLLDEGNGKPEARLLDVAFLTAVRALASRAPLVIAIDDVQWLDATTAALLAYAARRLRTETVLFLLARRADAVGEPTDLERAVGDRLQRAELGPLALGAIGAMIHERLDIGLPRPVLLQVHETSGGNPFYALELARALQRRTATTDSLPVPQSLRALVRERIANLPAETRETLLVVAAAAEPTPDLLGPLDLQPAIDAGIVALSEGRYRFVHPLLAASLIDDAEPAQLQRVHELLAKTVLDPEQRALHRAAATVGPDESVAAALEDAGHAASARGATAEAARLLERALLLTAESDIEARARRGSEAGRLYASIGDGVLGGELMRRAIDLLPEGLGRAMAIWLLLDSTTRIDDPVGLGEEALRHAGDDGDLSARIHSALGEIQLVRGEIGAALEHAAEARALARDELLRVVTISRAATLETIFLVGDPEADVRRGVELERRLRDTHTSAVTSPRNHLGRLLFWRDELADARELFEELRREAIETYADDARPNVCLYLARIAIRQGRCDDARGYADEAFELAQHAGYTQVIGGALSVRALVAAWSGDETAARALLVESDRVAALVADRWHTLHNRISAGLLAASLSRWEDVVTVSGALDAELDAIGVREPGIFPFEGDAIEAFVATGRLDEAERLIERQSAHERPRTQAVAARGRGLVQAARGDTDGATESFSAALSLHARYTDPLEHARTLLVYGACLRRARRKREARELLEEAAASFERLGSPLFAARARDELERLSGRRATSGLTATEERVANLVAQGLSNKQVAVELVVTVKAVEAHLTRIYAKLGVRSRAELMRQHAS